MDGDQFARTVAEGTLQRAQQLVATQEWSPATVRAYAAGTRTALVVLDEDLSAGSPQTAATSLVGEVVPGQRVMVARIRPFGLTVVGAISGDPNPWQTSTACKAGHGSYNLTPTAGTWTRLIYGGVFYDYGSHFVGGAAHTYTCASSGLYAVTANTGYTIPNAPHWLGLALYKNGAEADPLGGARGAQLTNLGGNANEHRVTFSTELACLAGDVLDVRYFTYVVTAATSGFATFRRVA